MNERKTLNSVAVLVSFSAACVVLVLLATLSKGDGNARFAMAPAIQQNRAINIDVPTAALPTLTAGVPPTIQITPTLQVIDRRYILAGKSPQEIAQYTVEHFASSFLGSTGSPTVLEAQFVTREEVPQLGLGCLPDNQSNAEPPYVLVVLQGDFAYAGSKGRFYLANTHYPYAALIVDVWAAAPTGIITSGSWPIPPGSLAVNCPPRTPGTLPYGAVLSGVVFPTSPQHLLSLHKRP